MEGRLLSETGKNLETGKGLDQVKAGVNMNTSEI